MILNEIEDKEELYKIINFLMEEIEHLRRVNSTFMEMLKKKNN